MFIRVCFKEYIFLNGEKMVNCLRTYVKKICVVIIVVMLGGMLEAIQSNMACREIACMLKPRFRLAHLTGKKNSVSTHPHIKASNKSSSNNWAGYAVYAQQVTNVSGQWVLPTITRAHNTGYCAVWVGIDGFESSTVEQIGTEQDVINGSLQSYAWFEMYPAYSYEISNFPVKPGDKIEGTVTYMGNKVFKLVIKNLTRGVMYTVPTSYTTSNVAQRNSAEWIVEAPYSGSILPLAPFSPVVWTQCSATIKGVSGSISNSHWQNTMLTMVTASNQIKAQSSVLAAAGSSFKVEWKHQ